jgi:homoserine O-acetyltransferase/O-succinyltransferase
MINHHNFHYSGKYLLESGKYLENFQLHYSTYGTLNKEKNNVIWICHALTGNSNFLEWWPGLFGENKFFDPSQYFIICANTLGGCYGSTGPLSINEVKKVPYFHSFPQVTNRDIIGTFDLLRKALGFNNINTLIGGSLGGQHALEWAVSRPEIFENLILLATNAKHSPWGIAFNESQRQAIAQDITWQLNTPKAGLNGMKVARSIALLSYRNYLTYLQTQSEKDSEKTDDFLASSYQEYQGEKLSKRFNAFTYWILSKAMDSHNIGRGRESIEQALSLIKAHTLIIGIKSDVLFPISEQKFIADHVNGSDYHEIDSLYGHDGFLIETEAISDILTNFYAKNLSEIPIRI